MGPGHDSANASATLRATSFSLRSVIDGESLRRVEFEILFFRFVEKCADTASRDQYVMELYLRHQLTPKIRITPGFQLIVDPSLNRDDDVIGIFEFRVRVVF